MHSQSALFKRLCTIAAFSAAIGCDAASAAPSRDSAQATPSSSNAPSNAWNRSTAESTTSSAASAVAQDGATPNAAIPNAAPSSASATNATASDAAPPAGASARERFNAYWSQFRSAIERNDKQALAALTRFPFETRGTYDDQPVRKHNAARFVEIIDELLEEDAGERKPISMRELILKTTEVTGNGFSEVQAGVGNFEFLDLRKGWRFVRGYTDRFEPGYVPPSRVREEKP
jgi:hypothetical protein